MKKYNNTFYASAAFAASLILSMPAIAQTVNNLNLVQPAPIAAEPEVQQEPQAPASAPEAAKPEHPAVSQHKIATKHHVATAHKHKKTTHKSVSAKTHKKKPAKKAETKHKPGDKKTTAPQPHASNTHKVVKHKVAKADAEKPAKKHASDVSTAALPVVNRATQAEAHTPQATTNIAPKSVTYNFCMGYSDCTPTRYQTTAVGNKAGAKVLQKGKDGNWAEATCDPTVMSDLNRMAAAEPNGRVERDLTPEEKELIADHQGKVHATLVSQVNSGNTEAAKNTMRQLNIQNINDLNAYDARLCKRETATQAVSEISGGR